MATNTVEVFQWSGTGYNATYDVSHKATFEDDDGSYDGSSDAKEAVSIDGGASSETVGAPYSIDISFTDTNGDSHVETFRFFNTDGSWYFAPEPGSHFTVDATLGSYQSHSVGWNYSDIVCFAGGTLIETCEGPVAVENLRSGTRVPNAAGDECEVRLVLRRSITADDMMRHPVLRPVRIMAGAMGNGLPRRDLLVSRQHRMLVNSAIARRMFASEVLVAAIRLTEMPGIFVENSRRDISYFHVVTDRHEVIFAEGCVSETLLCGPQALKSLPPAAAAEILALFPQISQPGFSAPPAAPVPAGRRQRKLIARHAGNNQPLQRLAGSDRVQI